MTIRLLKRAGASIGALVAALSATPALADSSMDAGPVTVTIGGFLASEGVYRSRSESADIGSSYNGVPFANQPTGHMSETRFTARQSRLTVMAQGDVNSDTHLTFWNEMDFLGAAQTANSNESNSYNLRIRNMYTTIDWDSLGLSILAGQNWSLATANTKGITPRNELVPTTIDAQYVVGFNWARQAQLRITKNWNKEFWVAASVENPQTTFAGNAAAAPGITVVSNHAGGSLFNSANNYSLNHIPDVIGKVAWEPVIDGAQPLHMEVYGIYRDFYDRTQIAAGNAIGFPVGNQNADRSGGVLGGTITYSFPKILDLQFTGATGSGLGRYGSGNLPDVTFRPDGTLAPIQETSFMAGATWHTTPFLDLYVYGGQEAQQRKTWQIGAATLGLGSPTLNLAGCLVENGSCPANIEAENQIAAGFWWKAYQGKFGSFRFGMQYSYTHLKSFSGVGGLQPSTDDSMVFTSIRYYPF
ncbi:MAG TPA: hypothetical protein VHY57_07205 [Rhizomicrobium sp.]|jgi:hypothetical protein|nr:hypothetical protein [Rhizomicrobium sp.]